jgi:integrase
MALGPRTPREGRRALDVLEGRPREAAHDARPRHTFASHLVMRGVALKAVQELLGHATMETTMRYAHLTPDVKRDAVRLLDVPVVQSVPSAGAQ